MGKRITSLTFACGRQTVWKVGTATCVHKTRKDSDDPPVNVCRISADRNGIYIRPQGYGELCSPDGDVCPAMFFKEMRVIVWDDIN